MKKLLLSTIALLSAFSFGQTGIQNGFGEFKFNPEKVACLTENQREEIFKELEASEILLKEQGILKEATTKVHPKFIWPVRKSAGAPYQEVWSISNHVDHNPNYPNQLQDWNCGNRTYDTSAGYNHQGIDIFTWPFSWFQFQNSQAEIQAAAEGVILYKSDGNFDMSCAMSGGNWNAVYVKHADGSVAWYGHMKKNSLTTKPVGATVSVGEYLGVVGSSGNSTGPHLHFEVYNSNNELVETYQGPCNNFTSGTDSWWQQQKPYLDPKINALLTHSAAPVFNTCPNTETTNLKNDFPTGSTVFGVVYLADQLAATSFSFRLLRPDNSIAYSTTSTSNVFYAASYWYWSFPPNIFNVNGNWKLEVTYQGQTVSHSFSYGILSTAENKQNRISIYPNPAKEFIVVKANSNEAIKKISIYDASGRMVNYQTGNFEKISISNLAQGTYLLTIQTEQDTYSKKFSKE